MAANEQKLTGCTKLNCNWFQKPAFRSTFTFLSAQENAGIAISIPCRETTGLSTDSSTPSHANGTSPKPRTTYAIRAFQRSFSAAEPRRFF
jgi:hypothetical protein